MDTTLSSGIYKRAHKLVKEADIHEYKDNREANSILGGGRNKCETRDALYPEKNIIQKETCTTMFIAALFTIARTWKQPKCPLTDEWIKKMWHIYAIEYYSAIKRNEIELFVVKWLDLES